MESSTAPAAHERATGSNTIADLIELAAERYGDSPAIRHKRDGEWRDVGYSELGEIVSEVGRGLIDVGIDPGDRVPGSCRLAASPSRRRTWGTGKTSCRVWERPTICAATARPRSSRR